MDKKWVKCRQMVENSRFLNFRKIKLHQKHSEQRKKSKNQESNPQQAGGKWWKTQQQKRRFKAIKTRYPQIHND